MEQANHFPHPSFRSTGGLGRFLAAGGLLALASALTVLAGTGCSSGVVDRDATIETLPSGAVRITHHTLPEHPRSLDTLAVWNLWGDEGDYQFNRFASASGVEKGFFLLDGGNYEVVRVDLQGNHLYHFGRRGQGPGEFQFPHFLRLNGDEIWVADLGNMRISIFDQEGGYDRDYRMDSYRWFHEGFAGLGRARMLSAVSQGADFENQQANAVYYSVVFDLEAGRTDTLASMVSLAEQRIEVQSSDGQGMVFFGPPQFAPTLHWSYAGENRVLLVLGTDYRITMHDVKEGSLLREIVAPEPDLTVTQRDRDWFFDEEGFRFGFGTGETFSATRESLERYPFADRRSAILGISVDPLGRLWVQASTEDPGRSRLDLFDLEGNYLGHLEDIPIPEAFTPEGHALLRIRSRDSMDVFCVVSLTEAGAEL